MTFRIPSADRRLSQPNNSDVQGNLYQTRNIDLDEEGYIKLASGTVSIFSETDDADFDNLNSMFHGSNVYFVGGHLFRESTIDLSGGFSDVSDDDTTPPTPGAEDDGVFFNGTEVVSDGSVIKYNNSGTWTTISGTPTGDLANPTALEVFPAQNSVLVGRGNQVARVNTSWAVAQTLTLPDDYIVLSIATNGNYAYIATRHEENGEAVLFLWTGINTTNDGSFGVGTYGIQAVRKYQSSVAIMDTLGRLQAFNGSGFTELASLPVYYTRANWGDANNDYANIYNRGMVVDGDLIYINISTEASEVERIYLPNQIGNIWCYDPKVGLYQKYSGTNSLVVKDIAVSTGGINTTTDVITVSGITIPVTGSPVYYVDGGTPIGGMITEFWYYVIKVTDTTFKVAETYEDAIAETAIDLTSATDNNKFYFINQKDYGQGIEQTTGACLTLNNTEYDTKQLGRFGFTIETRTTTDSAEWKYVQTCLMVRNLGYIISPKMFSDSTEDAYASAVLRFKPLKYGDKITVKYRTNDRLKLPALPFPDREVVTWTNSTTFTTPSAPNEDYYDFSTVEVGDEVEIIGGASSGFIAHVASISKSGFQYTVTLDTASPFYVSGDKSVVKIDNWKVAEVIDGATFNGTQKTVSIDTNAGWAQFKIVMEGTDVTLYDNIFTSKQYEGSR